MAEDVSQAASKIARQNVANIIAKLRAGRTLSISEQKAMEKWEAELTDGEWVKDTTALAKELGLNRSAIYDARARYPNEAPKKETGSRRENLHAWQRFCAEKLIGKDTATQTLSELKAQLMQREIRLRDMKIARESGEMVLRSVVEEMLGVLAQKIDLLLRLKLEVELGTRCAGKAAAEINIEGAEMLDEIRAVVNNNLATFQIEAIEETRREEEMTEKTSPI